MAQAMPLRKQRQEESTEEDTRYSPNMGLDTVELILRTEQVFGITLPDNECAQIRTVGDLYRLVLSKLDLPYIASEQIHGEDKPGAPRSRS